MGCGKKHYILQTKGNNLFVWGNVFKEFSKDTHTEGFHLIENLDELFDNGKIE